MEIYSYKRVILRFICSVVVVGIVCNTEHANSTMMSKETMKFIQEANENGPYLGLVIPNLFEMNPLLASPDFIASSTIDIFGRRFRFGSIGNKQVILVMTGLGMINAAITTQLLLTHFSIEGVVHYGIAGNANPSYQIGDVVVPNYWSHTGLWSWQRYGKGPDDELPLEPAGDYTRALGYLNFANYTDIPFSRYYSVSNLLNNVWYQPEEIFRVDATPEERKHSFWTRADRNYYKIAQTLKNVTLQRCTVDGKCLPREPKVAVVERGTSASIYVDNAAYRMFLFDKFGVTPIDMESASVSVVCRQQLKPFIAIRALSNLAGGSSSESNEADVFISLAAANSITAVLEFIKKLPASAAAAS